MNMIEELEMQGMDALDATESRSRIRKSTTKAPMETNSTVIDRLERRRLNCSRCKPHKRSNAGRQPRDDEYKSRRRGA